MTTLNLHKKRKHVRNSFFAHLTYFWFQKPSFNTNWDIRQNAGGDGDGDASHFNTSRNFEKTVGDKMVGQEKDERSA